ncbi:hypothetical protein LC593_10920 [Nostoc sp. CHAB 5844]|nr:hypothetical protein [Nostoc sp. CHAB 5844]
MKSCLNCIHGKFNQRYFYTYSYTGECGHWDYMIRDRSLDAVEINSEDPAEIERSFQKIGEQCPAWEAKL